MLINIVIVSSNGVGGQKGGSIDTSQLGDSHAGHRRHHHPDRGRLALLPGGARAHLGSPGRRDGLTGVGSRAPGIDLLRGAHPEAHPEGGIHADPLREGEFCLNHLLAVVAGLAHHLPLLAELGELWPHNSVSES